MIAVGRVSILVFVDSLATKEVRDGIAKLFPNVSILVFVDSLATFYRIG